MSQERHFILPYTQYTTIDGLSQLQVRTIYEDSRGYIWIGTQSGLDRFDGREIESFGTEYGIPPGMVQHITESPDGKIFGLASGHLFAFDGTKTKLFDYDIGRAPPFVFDKNGFCWSMNAEESLPMLFTEDSCYTLQDIYPKLAAFEPFSAGFTAKGEINYLTDCKGNIIYLDEEYNVSRTDSARFGNSAIETNRLERNGYDYYISFAGSIRPGQDSVFTIVDEHIIPSAVIDDNGRARILHHSAPGFIGMYFNNKPVKFIRTTDKYYPLERYNINHIRQGLVNAKGHVILASDEGLFVFPNNGWEVLDYEICPYVWAIIPDGDGDFFAPCLRDGLFRIDRGGKILNHYQVDNSAFKNPSENQMFPGHATAPNGRIIIGGYRGFYHIRNKQLKHFHIPHTIEGCYFDSLSGGFIIGGPNFYFTNADCSALTDTIELDQDEIGYLSMTDIERRTDSTIWASHLNCMVRFNPRDSSIAYIKESFEGLPLVNMRTVKIGPDGRLWAGGNKGLFQYDDSLRAFVAVLPEVFTGEVNQILFLPGERLYISNGKAVYILSITPDGMYLLDKYNYENGFQILEPSENGATFDGEYIYVPASTGVQRLRLDATGKTRIETNLLVRAINHQPFPFTKQKAPHEIKSNDLLVDLSLISDQTFDARYQFALDDHPWSDMYFNPQVFVRDVPNGKHKIRLRASLPGYPESAWPETILTVKNNLPLIMRSGFQHVAGVVSLLILAVLIYIFIKYQINRRKSLRLQHALASSRLNAIQSSLNPHFLFNAMSTLQNTILNRSRKEANKSLLHLARIMREVLKLGIRPEGVREETMQLIPLKEDLEFIEQYLSFEKKQHNPPFEYDIQCDPILGEKNPDVPPLLVQPLVENAVIHGLRRTDINGLIRLIIEPCEMGIRYTIRDNGVGYTQSRARKKGYKKEKSYGASLVKQRLQILNNLGSKSYYSIADHPHGGTIAIIELELKNLK